MSNNRYSRRCSSCKHCSIGGTYCELRCSETWLFCSCELYEKLVSSIVKRPKAKKRAVRRVMVYEVR